MGDHNRDNHRYWLVSVGPDPWEKLHEVISHFSSGSHDQERILYRLTLEDPSVRATNL